MKILLQTLTRIKAPFSNDVYKLESEIEFTTGTKTKRIQDAKTMFVTNRNSLPANKKLRVLEYHNDDPDNIRTRCKVIA